MYTVHSSLYTVQRRNGIGICSWACRGYDVRPRNKTTTGAYVEARTSRQQDEATSHFSSAPVRDIMLRFIISSLLSVESRVSVFSFALNARP